MPREITNGHRLLRAWLRAQGPASRKDPSRPNLATVTSFVEKLNSAASGEREIRSPFTVLDWIEGSGHPTPPGRGWRPIVERITNGEVPASSWESDHAASVQPGA